MNKPLEITKDGFVFHSSLKDETLPIEWHELWHEVVVWYGDITRKETAEELLQRLNEKYALITREIRVGDTVRCTKEDPMDDHIGIPWENRWHVGDTLLVSKIETHPWATLLFNEEGQNLSITRVEKVL